MQNNFCEMIKAQGNENSGHLTIKVVATIDKSGKVIQAQITQSSGNKNLDQLVLNACLNLFPVEPPPTTLDTPTEIVITFESVLR